jgi:hypothetical protein
MSADGMFCIVDVSETGSGSNLAPSEEDKNETLDVVLMPSPVRKDSPPPRQPSPDVAYTPLHPPRRPRMSLPSSLRHPSADKPAPKRLLNKHSLVLKPTGSSSASVPSSPSPRSAEGRPHHRRSSSIIIPQRSRSRSPPPSAAIYRTPPPPVPAIPTSILAPTDKKPILHTPVPRSPTGAQIHIPDLDTLSPGLSPSLRRQRRMGPPIPDGRDMVLSSLSVRTSRDRRAFAPPNAGAFHLRG